jgi:hypothetical protein
MRVLREPLGAVPRERLEQKAMLPPPLRGVEGLARYSRRLAHVTPEFLSGMFMEGFEWAGLDRWYGGQSPLQPTKGRKLNSTTAHRLVKFLAERAAGRPRKEVVDNTIRRYERLAAQWGYVVGVPRSKNRGPLRHLDVLSSTETRPSLEWRLQKGLVGREGGAAVTVVRRRPRPPEWERTPRRLLSFAAAPRAETCFVSGLLRQWRQRQAHTGTGRRRVVTRVSACR